MPVLNYNVKKLDKDGKLAVRVINTNPITDPIPVFVTDSPASDTQNIYAQVTSVASSTLTTIVSYTVPSDKSFVLNHVQVSGENIATYTVEIDSVVQALKRTYFTQYNAEFDFSGLEVAANSVVRVRVVHTSPATGDFDARILGIET